MQSKKLFGEITNIGMNEEISVGELGELIIQLCRKKIQIASDVQRIRPADSEVERLKCDNAKIKQATGWRPKYSLREGLKSTIDWIEKNSQVYKTDIYNL